MNYILNPQIQGFMIKKSFKDTQRDKAEWFWFWGEREEMRYKTLSHGRERERESICHLL